jgi:hypothetical protein
MATQKSTLAYLIPILLFAGLILLLTKELHPIENPDNGDFHTPLPVFSVPNLWAPKTNFTPGMSRRHTNDGRNQK